MKKEADKEIVIKLRQALSCFLVPLQKLQSVDVGLFNVIYDYTVELMYRLKGEDRISKSLLNELYLASRIIREESIHRKTDRLVLKKMADKLEMCFGLILMDELPEDRKPGIPRTI